MRLKHITFTGIDAKTDIKALQEIQEQYPIAEFGVLTSYHWYENGNRYIDPRHLVDLKGLGLNLSLHVCGEAAHNAAFGRYTSDTYYLVWGQLGLFRRIQLNIANRKDNPFTVSPSLSKEVIIQQRSTNDVELFLNSVSADRYAKFSMLLDASGGQGIDTAVEIYPYDGKIGYAGGINPENVADKLTYLLKHVETGEFWIDMESGVRTDDWFDLDKVRRVLAICNEVIKDLHMED